MTLSGRQSMGRLCYGKLHEFELLSQAEEKLRGEESALCEAISHASVKTLYNYRKLLRLAGRHPRVSGVKLAGEGARQIISQIISEKETWLESAKQCAFEADMAEKQILSEMCESETDEIQALKKLMM